jgi:hypothetical protein
MLGVAREFSRFYVDNSGLIRMITAVAAQCLGGGRKLELGYESPRVAPPASLGFFCCGDSLLSSRLGPNFENAGENIPSISPALRAIGRHPDGSFFAR